MADMKSVRTSLIYSEFSESDREKFFKRSEKKFISHIDTFYYVVYCDVADWRSDSRKEKFVSVLSRASALAAASPDSSIPVFDDVFKGLVCRSGVRFNMYSFSFSLENAFDVFVSDYTPNKDTPGIFVQLRSNGLWLKGTKQLYDESVDCLTVILSKFGLNIVKIVENRIDYAFHTNYIQDLLHYFPDRDLKEMQISQFHRWHREGYFFDDNIYCDYFTLGRRKSNNVFFRIYDKTKEVVEMGYKQFFIALWYDAGLISLYDKYVLEYTFQFGSWSSLHRARCHFYYEHGSDFSIRKDIGDLLSDPDTPYSKYKDIADKLVPGVTTVCNIEFQCKRKFFYNIEKTVPDLMLSDSVSDHIHSLIEQSKSITNYLTSNVIRFVKYKKRYKDMSRTRRPDADWWQRLRSCKMFEGSDDFAEYAFSYQCNLDLFRVRYNTLKSMARSSSFACSSPDDLDSLYSDDFLDFLGCLNDNDIQRYYDIKHKSFKQIESKRLKLTLSNRLEHDCEMSSKRYESLYLYWLSGIYHKNLDRSRFILCLKRIFALDIVAQDIYINMMESYNNRIDDKSVAYYAIMKYCFSVIIEGE